MSCCNNTKSNQEGMLIVNKAREAAACAEANCASSFVNATNAATSATNSQNSANDSADSASEANNYLTQVTNIFNDFDERYLGAKAVAPTVDNQGNPLQEGALYYNSTSNGLFLWNGSVWVSADFNQFTNFTATGTPTARNLVTRTADVVNVLDFGADPTGVADSYPAFLAAITLLKGPLGLYDGGTLYVPRGVYKVNQEIYISSNPFPSGASYSSGINIWIKGDGPYSTVLDFSSAPLGSNGIKFSNGGNCGVSDIAILNAPASGISLGDISGSTFQFAIKNVQCKFCGAHGIDAPKTYLGTIEDCWLEGNQGNGLNLDGFHTSMNVLRVSAPSNKSNGYNINGVVYSSFTACAADTNDFAGYEVKNCHGVTFDGCGCESNGRDGWFLRTGSAFDTGVPGPSLNIKGVVFNGCTALFNSKDSAGTYANFIRATTQNSRPIEIIVNGASSSENVAGNTTFQMFAYSGNISITRDFVHFGTTNDITKIGIVNDFFKESGIQNYEHDTTISTSEYNKYNYTAGNTFYAAFRINGVLQGNISYNGSNIVYATTSDYRLKEDIKPIVNSIDKINELNPVQFTWKSNNKQSNGFIAHELKEVIPNAVTGDKDEVNENGDPIYQCIDYSLVVPTLVAAVKELSAKVSELESKQNE